jgi:hypothetical protein
MTEESPMPPAEPMTQEIINRLKELLAKATEPKPVVYGTEGQAALLEWNARRWDAKEEIVNALPALLSTLTNLTPSGVERDLATQVYDSLPRKGSKSGGEPYYSLSAIRRILDTAASLALPSEPPSQAFQSRVRPWMLECFGAAIAADKIERNHRFLEESLELVQSLGCTASEAHQLVDYVFGRLVGEPSQEAGGVMVTLAALCLAADLDMHEAGETELARISVPETVAKIRAKQAAKPKHSPLPQPPSQGDVEGRECTIPPAGWGCSREAGHEGPCAARPSPDTHRGWEIRQGRWPEPAWMATGPNYDASYEGPEDGWVDNGQSLDAPTREALVEEIDEWIEAHEGDKSCHPSRPTRRADQACPYCDCPPHEWCAQECPWVQEIPIPAPSRSALNQGADDGR